ncbi:glycosyltransferase [Subtercola sp. Z020]|nr:glycosyltransferase [Subtercola sp. Z020]
MLTVIVIAKECLPGRVKTRLTPDVTFEQAALVASASLIDTLDVVRALPATRRILAFDGDPANAPAQAAGFDLIPQVTGALDARLADIFAHCSGPTLLVGMDTPQLTQQNLAPVLAWAQALDGATPPTLTSPTLAPPTLGPPTLSEGAPDAPTGSTPGAWLGLSTDGGFWALAMATPDGSLIDGVPMSQDDTGRVQLSRLQQAGLVVGLLDELTDVDTALDAAHVAALAPTGRFAAAWCAATETATTSQTSAPTPTPTPEASAPRELVEARS